MEGKGKYLCVCVCVCVCVYLYGIDYFQKATHTNINICCLWEGDQYIGREISLHSLVYLVKVVL